MGYLDFARLDGMFVGIAFEEVMVCLTEMGFADEIDMDQIEEGYYILVGSPYLYSCEMYFDEEGVCESCVFEECEE